MAIKAVDSVKCSSGEVRPEPRVRTWHPQVSKLRTLLLRAQNRRKTCSKLLQLHFIARIWKSSRIRTDATEQLVREQNINCYMTRLDLQK